MVSRKMHHLNDSKVTKLTLVDVEGILIMRGYIDFHSYKIQICFHWSTAWTTDAQWSLFSLKFRIFGLGQINWADKFWGIRGIFAQTISIHFGTVSLLSMFSIIQPLFLQKTKPLYPHRKYLFGIGISDLAFMCP